MDGRTLAGFRRMFKGYADEVEVFEYPQAVFLIIGTKRNTSQTAGQWYRENGEPVDWDFMERKCVVSGKDVAELRESARLYLRSLKTGRAIP